MKLTYLHRLFIYGFTIVLLVGYIMTKDMNLYSLLTHSLAAVLTAEVLNVLPAKVETK